MNLPGMKLRNESDWRITSATLLHTSVDKNDHFSLSTFVATPHGYVMVCQGISNPLVKDSCYVSFRFIYQGREYYRYYLGKKRYEHKYLATLARRFAAEMAEIVKLKNDGTVF